MTDITPGHVHDCTGPTATCPCGYQFRVPPVFIEICIRDGNTTLIDVCCNTSTPDGALAELEDAVERLKSILEAHDGD